MALLFWDLREGFRLAVLTKDGRNVLFGRIILVLGILGAILGGTYWGALGFRAFAEERGIIDVIWAPYYVLGLSILAIIGLITGAGILILSLLEEEERDMWLRSLLTHGDLSFYKGLRSLLAGLLSIMVLFGIPILVFGWVVWRTGLLDLFSGSLVILLVVVSFCILGNLLMGLLAICIPPRLRRRVAVGLAISIAVLLIAAAFYIEPPPDIIEHFYLMEEELHLAKEWFMQLMWLIGGLALAGGIALRYVWPLAYRLEKGPKEGYDVDVSLPVGWDTRFATLLGRLPLERSTRAFLKRDLILALRHPRVLIHGIIMVGITLAVSIGDELAAGPLFMVYFIPVEFASAYLGASLRTEGSNLDYIRMLLEKGNFLAGKIAATFLMVFFVSVVIVFICIALSPALEWGFVAVGIRILILAMAVLWATMVAMVFGEQILISGKGESLDRTVTRWFVGFLMATGWLLVDLSLTHPQIPGVARILLLPVFLIILGGMLYYFVLRLRKFARAIEDV